MKKVLILKAKPGPARSSEAMGEKLEKKGIPCIVATYQDVSMFFQKGKAKIYVGREKLDNFSLVIFRTVGKKVVNREIASIFSRFCEENSIRYFDKNFKDTDLTPKLLQMYLFCSDKLTIPKTYYFGDKKYVNKEKMFRDLKFPIIAKKSYEDRGNGIFLLKDKTGFNSFIKTEKISEYIFQEFIPNTFDWRLTVIGDNVGVSEKRIRQGDDFRNNVYLGALEEFAVAPSQMKKDAVRSSKILKLTLAGVDVISYKKRNYILEVNRAPSFTLDEKISQELNEFEKYILKCLK